jgi:sporulation protein YlmC with PRC-barrel domain
VELTAEPGAFSELIGVVVRDQAGRRLGRVYEVRAHRQGDGSIVFDELLIGRRALLRRLRGPGSEARGIPWEAVVELAGDRIVVRDPGGR